jgi:lysophospholipase L1-like esterase
VPASRPALSANQSRLRLNESNAMPAKRTDWLKNVGLLGLSLLISGAIGELVLRILKPQLTYSQLIELAGTYYAPSDYSTFQLKANYHGSEPSMEHPGQRVTITTNSDRFRNDELDPTKKKILVLGDSYTFGVYVNDNETYPAILNELVKKVRHDYQVINAGYTDGWETDQQFVWLRHNIKALQPKIVVLGIFLANDITGIDTQSWVDLDQDGLPNKWISKDLYVSEGGFLKNNVKGLSTVGVESIYQLPGFRESHLAILVGKALDKIVNRFENRTPIGYEETSEHIFGHYTDDFLKKEAIFLNLLRAMKKLSNDNGSKFMVALLPANFMVEREKFDFLTSKWLSSKNRNSDSVYYARLAKLLQQLDIPAVDIESEMKRSKLGPFFPANGEVHFNPKGHSFTAARIFDFLCTSYPFK